MRNRADSTVRRTPARQKLAAVAIAVDALPAGVGARGLAHGTLLFATSEGPFNADREPMERAVVPFIVEPCFDEPDDDQAAGGSPPTLNRPLGGAIRKR